MHRFGNSLNSCTGKLYMLKGLYLPNKVNCRFHLQVGRLKPKQMASITCQGCRNQGGGPGCLAVFSLIYTSCSEIQKSSFEFQNNFWTINDRFLITAQEL